MAKNEKMTDKAAEAAKKAGKGLKDAAGKAASNAAALNNKVIDHAEANTRAAFAAMRSAASVKATPMWAGPEAQGPGTRGLSMGMPC